MAKRPAYAAEILAEDRARISAILESPEGRANMTTALELALRTDMHADSARAILKTMPPENPFAAAMAREAIGIGPASATLDEIGTTSGESAKAARLKEITAAAKAVSHAKGFTAAPKTA